MDPALVERIRRQIAWETAREGPPAGFPALPPLPTGRYTDPAFFALERERVWRRSWLLAGREEELPEPGCYLRFDRAAAPVLLVRGSDGRLRAFYNTCQHRGAPVVRAPCGRAKRLRCQYHSWTYDLEGRLVGVPERRDFAELREEERGLVPLRCESYGGWVFVNEDPQAPPLDAWLGPVADEWRMLGGEALRTVARRHRRIPCNWKIAADAFLETYHLKTIHPESVARLLDPRGAVMGLLPGGHSRMVTPKWPEALAARGAAGDLPHIPGTVELVRETNVAYGVFPNLITPLDTFGFPFITFWPADVCTTDVDWTWYAPAGEREDAPFWKAMLEAFDAVMEEDFANLEPMQRSVASGALRSIPLSYQERRIRHLHEEIDRRIGPEHIPETLRVAPILAPFVEGRAQEVS